MGARQRDERTTKGWLQTVKDYVRPTHYITVRRDNGFWTWSIKRVTWYFFPNKVKTLEDVIDMCKTLYRVPVFIEAIGDND